MINRKPKREPMGRDPIVAEDARNAVAPDHGYFVNTLGAEAGSTKSLMSPNKTHQGLVRRLAAPLATASARRAKRVAA